MLRVLFTYRIGRVMEIEKMITKKEDLINTYVKTDCEELVNLYLKKCKEFGFTWFSGKDINSSKANGSAVGLNEDVKLSVTNGSLDYFNDKNCRELSLLDVKPRTKTEFVKCEFEHAWEIIKLYEDGEELFKTDSGELQIERINSIALRAQAGYPFYRKVETEIDERQEFVDRMLEMLDFNEAYDGNKIVSDMYGNFGFRFKLEETDK